MIRFKTGQAPRTAARHLFVVGQKVHLKSWFADTLRGGEIYSVTACLPVRDNEFQYRIRADSERHERVAGEDAIESVASKIEIERIG